MARDISGQSSAKARRDACWMEALEARQLLSNTVLSTGSGPGSLQVTVDGYGSYGSSTSAGNALYQPLDQASPSGTTFESGVFFSPGDGFLSESSIGGPALPSVSFASTSESQAVSRFSVAGYDFELTQTVAGGGGAAILTQQYTITNSTGSDQTLNLVRFVDGDLQFVSGAGNDFAGVAGDGSLFESDGFTDPTQSVGFFLIGGGAASVSAGGSASHVGYTVQDFPYASTLVQNRGIAAADLNRVAHDANGDKLTDTGEDITLSLGDSMTIPAGGQAVYVTVTLFGQGPVNQLIPNPVPTPTPTPTPTTQSGTLDPAFGLSGSVNTDFAVEEVEQYPDGTLLAVGHLGSLADGNATSLLERYSAAGAVDQSFGSNGRVANAFSAIGGARASSAAYAVAVGPSGHIFTAGEADGDMYVAKYNYDGSLDPSFGNGGVAVVDLGGSDRAFDLVVQSDGKIIAGGQSNGDVALIRLDANGALDPTFGNRSGAFVLDLGSADDAFGALALAPNGTLAAAGTSGGQFVLCNFLPTGLPNPAWVPQAPFNGVWSPARAGASILPTDQTVGVAVQPDGNIVCVGQTDSGDFATWRLNNVGDFDPNFSGNFGAALGSPFRSSDLGGLDDADEVVILSDGRILVTGTSTAGNVASLAVAAYKADGTPDTTFGNNGILLLPDTLQPTRALHIGDLTSRALVAEQADGSVVIGSTQIRENTAPLTTLRRLDASQRTVNPPVSKGFFGRVAGQRGNTILRNLTDADGSVIQVRLNGSGFGEAITTDDGLVLNLSGTGRNSTLVISASGGNGRADFNAIRTQDGTLGNVMARNTDLNGQLLIGGAVRNVNLGNLNGARVNILGSVNTLSAGTVNSSTVAVAGNIITLGLGAVNNSVIWAGANLGDNGTLGGSGADADSFGPARITNAKFAGAFNSSRLIAGLNSVDGVLFNGDDGFFSPSQIRSLNFSELSADSRVAADELPKRVRIGRSNVDPATDGRFVS